MGEVLQVNPIQCALAPETGNKTRFFADPDWEVLLERLLKYTTSTRTLMELTGTDHKQAHFNMITTSLAGKVSKPRGAGSEVGSRNFLKTDQERFDASYLMSLLHGGKWVHAQQTIFTSRKAYCETLLEVYSTYLRTMYGGIKEDAAISFDQFLTTNKSLQTGHVTLHNCPDCASRYVWPSTYYSNHSCPTCTQLQIA